MPDSAETVNEAVPDVLNFLVTQRLRLISVRKCGIFIIGIIGFHHAEHQAVIVLGAGNTDGLVECNIPVRSVRLKVAFENERLKTAPLLFSTLSHSSDLR